jgi:NAD+ synthetase
MKIALGQINPTVGDIVGNEAKVAAAVERAEAEGADVVLLPELVIPGYPPKDLVLRRSFVDANLAAVERIAALARRVVAVVGFVKPTGADRGKGLHNAGAVCAQGRVQYTFGKALLPTYDVFDERRYFDADEGPHACRVSIRDREVTLGLSICEDLWVDDQCFSRRLYDFDPIEAARAAGAEVILNIGASPFSMGRQEHRVKLFCSKAASVELPIAYVNQVGGNDDLVFDGASGAIDASGRVMAQAKSFAEDFLIVDLEHPSANRSEATLDRVDGVYRALALGTRDYVEKCGFGSVVIGVSGGIDSAVTAAIAVDALGAERVHLVAMPSRYSSDHSLADAAALAESLGASMITIPIEEIHAGTERVLAAHFEGRPKDVTEENIQSRARGAILMALSNKFGHLLLTTGNKSEIAVGYCTLYGDMCGGLAVLSDVPKTLVYALAEHVNRVAGADRIPRRTMTKPPSAELKDDQFDADSLPPYDVLDPILERYVEREEPLAEIVSAGFDADTVAEVARLVDRNEHKRKQSAVGLRVTGRAFGIGRRMPIAARHRY